MTAFFRLLSIAGLSMTLLVACSDNETTIEEAYKSAHDQPNETADPAQAGASSTPQADATGTSQDATTGTAPDKDSAAGAVQAARDAVAASNAQTKKTNEATEAAIKNN
ncbi:hypothetical protein ACFQ2T_00725 [Methylophilus flavus]|uniref:Secreted protein n=1 Tax=Methylophilus flavus TaxID=640084 RepID=A0ABW3P4E5_9PROT